MRRFLVIHAAFAIIFSAFAQRIDIDAVDFTASRYLSAEELTKIREKGILIGTGEVDYPIQIQQGGWYELWVQATGWATDLYLDGDYLIHTPFASGIWPPKDKQEKVLNLFLHQGDHTLTFSRPWFPGLPWMRGFSLQPASSLAGQVRLAPMTNALCFRLGQEAPVSLSAARQPAQTAVHLIITRPDDDRELSRQIVQLPAGEGNVDQLVMLPTDTEGAFDLHVKDADGNPLDRIIQYLVVDTQQRPPAPATLERELVQTIDCAAVEPDYEQGETRVIASPIGRYRESGDLGHVENGMKAHWFAYTLALPEVQVPYLLEIDYPDDDERTFTYSVAENNMPGGRTLTHGVASGGRYSLSERMQTAQMLFYPRQQDPRIHFRTWWNGQRAAAATIRIYRIRGGFPDLLPPDLTPEREFGRYQEEPIRFVQWGARQEGNTWQNLWDPAARVGEYSRHVGVNFWQPTIAIYGAAMWPSKFLPSLDRDADSWGVGGGATRKEPLPKDTIRLCLLASEKYGLRFLGELYMPCTRPVARHYFEKRFGGDGDIAWNDPTAKPWLIVHRTGGSPGTPTFNPLHPGIQQWVGDIVAELADRYYDSPAYAGVAIRFMSWQFHGWQGFPSIEWGYGDENIAAFEADRGWQIPVDQNDPARFQKRHDWLLANHYEEWVDWRCRMIYRYHETLARLLTDRRPDLKLYLDLHGPSFGADSDMDAYDRKGWTRLLRETGIDVEMYRNNDAIVIRDRRHYPPGIRGVRQKEPVMRAAAADLFYDAEPIRQTARIDGEGTIAQLHFDANSFESDMFEARQLGLVSPKPESHLHGAGLVFPAGRHFLERYAVSMADGNLVSITDGSHGYISQPPDLTRAFTAEYQRLPAIGMQSLGSGDPVALWQGARDGKNYFYLVNRCAYAVTATVTLPEGARLRRLLTGDPVDANPLRVTLEPYALIGYVNDAGQPPVTISTDVPEEVVAQLRTQIAAAGNLFSMQEIENPLVPFSLVDLQKAKRQAAEADTALREGRTWAARQALLHHDAVRIYAALDAWPEGLLFRKTPPAPQGAMLPPQLHERLRDSAATVEPATRMANFLTGAELLAWNGGDLQLALTLPVANRYRFSYACVAPPFGDAPVMSIDGESSTGDFRSSAPGWYRQTLRSPFSLDAGQHQVTFRTPQGSRAGLFYLDVEPCHRQLTSGNWAAIGPFPSQALWRQPPTGMGIAYPPELGRDFTATYEGIGQRQLRWQPIHDDQYYVDFYALTGAYSEAVCYAVTTITSPNERDAELLFGLDYWGKVWLNGEELITIVEAHSAPEPGQFVIPVRLRKGDNELFVKINAGSQGNGFWMGISDPGDLTVAAPVLP